jgi:hypothetical protein
MNEEPSTSDLAKLLAPFLALTALVSILAMVILLKLMGGNSVGLSSQIVTFDIVRFNNAQRAVASSFLKREGDHAGAAELLNGLSDRTRQAISDIAGKGTTVVVKQAVVQGDVYDITEEVLEKLGLPLNTPTSDPSAYVLDVAPTMLLAPPPAKNLPELPGERTQESTVLP